MNLKKHVVVNYIFSFANTGLLLYTIGFASANLLPVMLGIVLLARKHAGTWSTFLQMGMSQGIRRYLPMSENGHQKNQYAFSSVLIVIPLVFVTGLIIFFLKDFIGPIIFPAAENSGELLFYSYLLVLSRLFTFLARSLAISEFRVALSGILEAINSSIIFFFCVLFLKDIRVELFLRYMSIAALIAPLLFLSIYFLKINILKNYKLYFDFLKIKELFVYGLPRAVSSFAEMFVFLIGPWILADKPEAAANLIIAYTVFRILPAGIIPLTQIFAVALAKASNNKKKQSEYISYSLKIVKNVFFASIIPLIFYKICGREILNLWIKEASIVSGVEVYLDYFVFFIPAIASYYCIRNIIDTIWTRPYNMIFLFLSFLVFIISYWLAKESLNMNMQLIVSMSSVFMLFYFYVFFMVIKLNHLRKALI